MWCKFKKKGSANESSSCHDQILLVVALLIVKASPSHLVVLLLVMSRLVPLFFSPRFTSSRFPLHFRSQWYGARSSAVDCTYRSFATPPRPPQPQQGKPNEPAPTTSDPPVLTWVENVLPSSLLPYARLSRWDKPIGTMLLVRPSVSVLFCFPRRSARVIRSLCDRRLYIPRPSCLNTEHLPSSSSYGPAFGAFPLLRPVHSPIPPCWPCLVLAQSSCAGRHVQSMICGTVTWIVVSHGPSSDR